MLQNKQDLHKIQLALETCHLYYEDGLSQNEIAKKLEISRPTVSRLLQFARQQGLVKIEIVDPLNRLEQLSLQLADKYSLKEVRLTYDTSNQTTIINEKLGELTANYLDEIVEDNDSIGISWGRTLEAVANKLHPSKKKGVKVVELKGSVSASEMNNYAKDIISKFNTAFHTETISLPLPVFFDSAITKDIVTNDRFIKNIITAGQETNIALFTSGTVLDSALLFKLGYLNEEEIKRIKQEAVGDIISRFLTKNGDIADPEINSRTVGISLNSLKNKKYSILISGSSKKVASIHAALIGGYANVLITDSISAEALLSM
ncbi:TPA: sugar-binding transcriptional regulator [Enterococcus faecium]|nr:sugar-binding transcriptional regulator [Enterococcus faecium]